MFEQTRAFRIRFQLPEEKIGRVREIRTLAFNEDGIHVFEGTYEEFQSRARYLKNFGVVPLELPDMSSKVKRPLPTGTGKHKVANVAGARDDLDDLSEFKEKPGGSANNSTSQGNGQSPPVGSAGSGGATDIRHGARASPAKAGPARTTTPVQNGVRPKAEVAATEDDDDGWAS